MLKITSPNGTVCPYLKSAQDYLANGGDVATYYKGNTVETNQAIPIIISWQTDKDAKKFMEIINSFDGKTLNEKVENLVLSLGITKEQINSLRKIMIG